MKLNKKKIMQEISSLPADELEKLYKFINSLKEKRKQKLKLKTISLRGKLDNENIRSLAYD